MIPGTTVRRFLRHALIRTGLEGISLTRAGRFWRGAAGRGIIFTLHHVRPPVPALSRPNALLTVTPAFLEQAILACREHGLVPVALEDLPTRLADPRDENAYVCFTLDDGYRDNAQFAAPIFRKHAIPYTIFACAGFVERSRSIWWETLEALLARSPDIEFDFGCGAERLKTDSTTQKLTAFDRFADFVRREDEDEAVARIDALARAHGLDPIDLVDQLTMDEKALAALSQDSLASIGAHSLTHVNLRRFGPERLARELSGSAEAVERYVGRLPPTFAYPYGYASAVGEREAKAAAAAGFSVAVNNRPGVLDEDSLDRLTSLNRVSLNGSYQRRRYVDALISGIPFKFIHAPGTDFF